MPVEEDAIRIVDDWYTSLDLYRDDLPSKGSIAAALQVLNLLRSNYDLDVSAHVARGEAQITGLSAGAIKKILAEFGESRRMSVVGGRTNRGARGAVAKLLGAMKPLHLEQLQEAHRVTVLRAMQKRLVAEYVPRFFAVKRVKAVFDYNEATWRFVQNILENAKASGKAGAVAEYLVGAKLAILFPNKQIRNKRFSIADEQTGFPGDFEVGNTVFHVTVAPMPDLLDKCKGNLERGLRVYLLVLEAQVVGTRQNMEMVASGRTTVQSIESFVATNIDELTEFGGDKLKGGLRRLLEKYNERVGLLLEDKSMLIEIPSNLD
ncbi:MAG: DUF4928 family protein [Tepidisphaeraceae bacterium]|jgi:uncharacterized protein DUF4928